MHVQFLIGPMKLRTSRQHPRIFEVPKSRLGPRLPTIRFDDLRSAPFATIRDQNPQAEIARGKPTILLQVAPSPHLRGDLSLTPASYWINVRKY